MNTLVENKYGHGARRVLPHSLHRAVIKVKRAFRPKLAQATAPFNWQTDTQIIKNRLAQIGAIKIKNQFQSMSCGGQAGSYWLGIVWAITKGLQYVEFSARSIYSLIYYKGGGTTDGDLQNQIANVGAMTEAMVSSYLPDGTTTEAQMTDKSWATPPNLIIASQYSNWQKVSVGIDKNSIACAIRDHIAVVWHIQGQNGQNWGLYRPLPPSKTNPNEIWGHFMELDDVEPTAEDCLARQSWGTEVGNQGIQAFNDNYISSGYVLDVWTWVLKTIPGTTIPNPIIISWQQRLFSYFWYTLILGH